MSNLAVAAVLLLVITGCGKSGSRAGREEKISGSPSDAPFTFDAKWAPSNACLYRVEMTASSELPPSNAGNPGSQETTLAQDYLLTVTNTSSDSGRGLELEFRTVQLEMSVGDKISLAYDSENRVIGTFGNPVAEVLQRIVGGRLRYTLSPSNTVTKLEGVREFTERVVGSNARGQANNIFRRYFNPAYFKELVEMNAFPTDAVRIGESWEAHRDVAYGPGPNMARADLTCTFKGWQTRQKRNCALVTFRGVISAPPPDRRKLIQPVPLAEVKGTLTGSTWFDPASGLAVETVTDQTIRFQTAIRRVRNADGNQSADTNAPPPTFTTTMRRHVSVKLLELSPTTGEKSKEVAASEGK